MGKGNHREHKRKAHGADRHRSRGFTLALLQQRTDTGSQDRECRYQPQIANDPYRRGHRQLYCGLPVSWFSSVVFVCRYTARMSASPTAASAAATPMEKSPKIIPVETPVWGPKRQKATKLRLAAFNISSMPTSTRMVFRRVNAPARPTANSMEETSKHPANGVIACPVSPSWPQPQLLSARL